MINTKRLFIILILAAFIPGVFAETGTISLDNDQWKLNYTTYSGSGQGSGNIKYDYILFDYSDYNRFYSLVMYSTKLNYPYEANSTRFTITSGGSGGGTVSYSKSAGKIYYFFDDDVEITGSPIILSFVTDIFSAGMKTPYASAGKGTARDSDHPAYVAYNYNGGACGQYCNLDTIYAGVGDYALVYFDAVVGKTVENNYNITYFSSNPYTPVTFTANITKAGVTTVNTKIVMHNGTSYYYNDSTYTNTNIIFTTPYENGLYINMSVSGGAYEQILVNSSGMASLTDHVDFSNDIYNSGEAIQINYTLIDPDFSTKYYYMKFYNPADSQIGTLPISAASGSWTPSFNQAELGNYSVWLGYQYLGCGFFCYDTFLDDDFANYGNVPTNISGNITTNKAVYNQSETMTIYYNTTTAGKIEIKSMDGFVTTRDLNAYAGNNKLAYYTFQLDNDPLGEYLVSVIYKNNNNQWIYLDSVTVNLISQTGFIDFYLSSYFQTEIVDYYYYALEAGNITVYDPNGNIKHYRAISSDDLNNRTDDSFYVSSNDLNGTWTAKLFNASGEVDNATVLIISSAVPSTYTPTPTATATAGVTVTVDYVGNLTTKRAAENQMLNTFYTFSNGLLMMAFLATMVFFLKKMRF